MSKRRYTVVRGPLTASDKRQISRWVKAGRNPDDGSLPKRGRPIKKSRKKSKKWIQKLRLKRGALHRQLRIPLNQKIPLSVLHKAAKAPGILGRRARFALNMRKFHHKGKRKTR